MKDAEIHLHYYPLVSAVSSHNVILIFSQIAFIFVTAPAKREQCNLLSSGFGDVDIKLCVFFMLKQNLFAFFFFSYSLPYVLDELMTGV